MVADFLALSMSQAISNKHGDSAVTMWCYIGFKLYTAHASSGQEIAIDHCLGKNAVLGDPSFIKKWRVSTKMNLTCLEFLDLPL